MHVELAYLMRRMAQERAAARQAQHRRARDAHLGMAERYEERLHEIARQIRTAEVGLLEAV